MKRSASSTCSAAWASTIPPEITSLLDITAAVDELEATTTFRGDDALLDDLPKVTTDNVVKLIPQLALDLGTRPHYAHAATLLRDRLIADARIYAQVAVPTWLDELRGMFEPLADVVHANAGAFPEPLTAPDAVFGPEIAERYRELKIAVTALDALRPARQVLARLAGEGDVDVSMFVAAPPTVELLERAIIAFPSVGGNLWHRLVVRGLTLRAQHARGGPGIPRHGGTGRPGTGSSRQPSAAASRKPTPLRAGTCTPTRVRPAWLPTLTSRCPHERRTARHPARATAAAEGTGLDAPAVGRRHQRRHVRTRRLRPASTQTGPRMVSPTYPVGATLRP